MIPEKIDTCWAIRNELNAMVKMSPTYLALSPVSICRATQLIAFCSLKNIRAVKFSRGLDCLTISIAITTPIDDDYNLSNQIFLRLASRCKRIQVEGFRSGQNFTAALRVNDCPGGDQHASHGGEEHKA